MRRFELVEGKSNKFWEIAVDGTDVTTQWGRIGTNGQAKTKSFADAKKAKAEHDKLIREKTKKGYIETGAAAEPEPTAKPELKHPGPGPLKHAAAPIAASPSELKHPGPGPSKHELPDEDALVLPDAWSRRIHPRRGGRYVPPKSRLDPKKAWAAIHKSFRKARAKWTGDAAGSKLHGSEMQSAAVSWLLVNEKPAPVPTDVDQAAQIVRMLGHKQSWSDKPVETPLVDWLVGVTDPVFAVRAFLRSYDFTVKGYVLSEEKTDGWSHGYSGGGEPGPLTRLRRLLVEADDDVYRAARDAAAPVRDEDHPSKRIAASYLFPTETGWVGQDVADFIASGRRNYGNPILASVGDVDHARQLTQKVGGWAIARHDNAAYMFTFVDALGDQVLPILEECFATVHGDAASVKSIVEAVAILPTDAAMEFLVSRAEEKYFLPALTDAMQRFPQRATRIIAPRLSGQGRAADRMKSLMGALLRKSPAAAEAALTSLSETDRTAVEALRDSTEAVLEAAADDVPSVLLAPPWASGKKKKRAKEQTIKGVEVAGFHDSISWEPGERERWAASTRTRGANRHGHADYDAEAHLGFLERLRSKRVYDLEVAIYVREAPEERAHTVLAEWAPDQEYWIDEQMPAIVAEHELHALPALVRFAEARIKNAVKHFLPYRSPLAAIHCAEALVRLKSARNDARRWLLRHPEAAAIGLIPHAVGRKGKKRHHAEQGLGFLVTNGHREVVAAAARKYDDAVASAIEPLLDFDPLDAYPAKMPKLPSFWDAGSLPAPVLRDGKGALPIDAIEHLGTMLAFCKPGQVYPGLEHAREACTPESFARFAWALFDAWLAAGAPSKESWAFTAMGLIGDDECARKLTPLLREWPGQSAHARAVVGLDVLAEIGTDVALMHLHGISQKLKFKGLREKAKEKIGHIAEERGLTPEQLADRLVPDLGLDESGSLALDFGTRTFTVGFDEHLKPYVLDESKKRLKSLPKPGKKDDAEVAAAATKTWKALKKDARTAAKQQILRMEVAMCKERRWPLSEFRMLLVDHPLMIHVVRRLVWGAWKDGALVRTFRVAEDRSFADPDDEEIELPDGAEVGVVHALALDENFEEDVAARWGEVFGDYEILQPFRQLGRDVHLASDAERATKELDVVEGVEVAPGKILGLEKRGWEKGSVEDGGVWYWIEKPLSGGMSAHLYFEPGIITGLPNELGDQKLMKVVVTKGYGGWGHKGDLTFGELSAVAFSELVSDLTSLRG